MNKATEATINALRTKKPRGKKSYMAPTELQHLREEIIKTTQVALAKILKNPQNGEPLAPSVISRWEAGKVCVPLWAAQKIRMLSEHAKHLDAGEFHPSVEKDYGKI